MGNLRGYAEKVSRVVLSFVDETFFNMKDCYIPEFCIAFVVCELMIVLSVCIYLILMRKYIYENYYALEFMRWKFHEL